MKVHKSLVNQRRNDILRDLMEKEELTVNQISEKYKISSLTVRRDLDCLTALGKIKRFHGGARIIGNNTEMNNVTEQKKNAIAKKAAELLRTFDTVFINSSSTALLILKYITTDHVTVITNNAKCLYDDYPKNTRIILTGGNLTFPKETLTGEFAMSNLEKTTASKAILGCSGLSPDVGLTTSVIEEASINRLMLKNAVQERIIVTDSSKLGHNHTFVSSTLESVSTIITDTDADKGILKELENQNIKIILVDYKEEE